MSINGNSHKVLRGGESAGYSESSDTTPLLGRNVSIQQLSVLGIFSPVTLIMSELLK